VHSTVQYTTVQHTTVVYSTLVQTNLEAVKISMALVMALRLRDLGAEESDPSAGSADHLARKPRDEEAAARAHGADLHAPHVLLVQPRGALGLRKQRRK